MKTNFKKNTIFTLIYQLLVACSGFILPKLFIQCYGSSINGSIATIGQITGFLGLLEAGMGSVASVAYYRSLANKEGYDLTVVRNTIRRFYRQIGIVSIGICVALAVLLPFSLDNGETFAFNAELVLIVGCGYFIQYYFAIDAQLLLAADCKAYINSISQIIAVLLNFGISVVLLNIGIDVRLMKLVSAMVLFSRPVLIAFYARENYKFSKDKQYDNSLIKQRWNNFGQSLAFYVHGQTDMVVIMLFHSIAENSVYSLHVAVVAAVKMVMTAVMNNFNPILGRVCALKTATTEEIRKTFDRFVVANEFLLNVLFSTMTVLIVPFMRIYTNGLDYEYVRPAFAYALCAAEYIYLYRTPYNTLINVNGHFKETQNSAFIEAGLNIVGSLALVQRFGILGVTIATVIAMFYRWAYCVVYAKRKLLDIPIADIAKSIVLTTSTVGIVAVVIYYTNLSSINSYITFFASGFICVGSFAIVQVLLMTALGKINVKKLIKK